MAKIIRRLHNTRTARINATFFTTWFTQFTAIPNRSTYQTRVWSWSYMKPRPIASSMERHRGLYASQQDTNHFYENFACCEHVSCTRIFIRVLCDGWIFFLPQKAVLLQTEMLFPKMVPCLHENAKFLAEAKFASRELQMAVNLVSLVNTSSLHAAINISGSNDSTTIFPHL